VVAEDAPKKDVVTKEGRHTSITTHAEQSVASFSSS
jgi:hypothetical protein